MMALWMYLYINVYYSCLILQYSNKDHHIYKLEQKVKLLERQLSVAEERCRENAGLLSKNSLDTSKLETALTQQTKVGHFYQIHYNYGLWHLYPVNYSCIMNWICHSINKGKTRCGRYVTSSLLKLHQEAFNQGIN